MTGRLADFFRLVWGLLYWNTRKTWFRLRRGRSPCPCQSPSDSGRAFETACDASLSWDKAARFRRVCPLLVETPDGLRCSVNTADVRPFWGRAAAGYGGTFAVLYLGGALAIFIFLRTVGYPINIGHLVWPGSWHRVTEVRGWFFMERANRAFAVGRNSEGLLYLANAYEFDPANYTIASMLAQRLQLSHAVRADDIYRRLLTDHPAQRATVSQLWFRSLLARGDFVTIETLAHDELLADPGRAGVWMRALVFATRQTGSDASLHTLLASPDPAAQGWRPLLETELLLRAGRHAEARSALNRTWPASPAYGLYYQISELIALGDGIAAVDFLGKYGSALDDTARAMLLLEAYATLNVSQSHQRLVASLLSQPLTSSTIRILTAHLIRHPDPALFGQLLAKFTGAPLPLTDDNLETYLALYCTAGVHRDWANLQALGTMLQQPGRGSRFTLAAAAAFFRGEMRQTRVSTVLPALPMPLEVHYALLERYPGPQIKLPPSR